MNVLIAADMEGIAGIESYRDCLPSHPAAYRRGRRQMTDEVLVAIEALRGASAERILLLDGDSLSETQTYAQALAAERVPILVAAGDRWLLEEMREGELGSARLLPTKEGEGRGRARSVEPADAHVALRAAIAAAAAAPQEPPPLRSYPAELVIKVEGEEIARTTVATAADLLTAVAGVFRTSQVSKEYRQLAKLMPPADSRLRSFQRRAGSTLATPVMRSKEKQWLAAAPPYS